MEQNENINEFKPRKWLLVILIIVALAITVVLVNGIVTSRKDSKSNFFNIFNMQSAKSFNRTFEFYVGTSYEVEVSNLLDKIITNNKTNADHQIEVTFKDITTSNPDEIKAIKQKIATTDECEISFDYDENGYINKATIEISVNVMAFNTFIEFYSGSQYGTALSNLLDTVITSNKKYPDNQITIAFGTTTTTDPEEIKNMKKDIDTWTEYEVSMNYDENGYVNKIIIEQ